MGRGRYVITEPEKPHFLTCTVMEWLPMFTRTDAVGIVLDNLSHPVDVTLSRRWSVAGCIPTLERGNEGHFFHSHCA